MTAPDPLALRLYRRQIESHQKTATAALRDLKTSINNIDVTKPAIGAGYVRNAADTLAELGQALAALRALHDVEFLTEDTP